METRTLNQDDPLRPSPGQTRVESQNRDDPSVLIVLLLTAILVRLMSILGIRSIQQRQRLRITFNGSTRIIEPYRLWRQQDGSFLLEAYQIAGGSKWGDMGAPGFRRSPLGGYEAWISIPLEKIELMELAGGPFTPRDEYAEEPERRLGKVFAQVLIGLGIAAELVDDGDTEDGTEGNTKNETDEETEQPSNDAPTTSDRSSR